MRASVEVAYLAQARSDLDVFDRLSELSEIPECHALHALQMATEKLAKAIALRLGVDGFDRFSHVAFSLLPGHLRRRDVSEGLGWTRFDAYEAFLRKAAPLFRAIDELNPAVGASQPGGGTKEGPNVEYPWPGRDGTGAKGWVVPSEHAFGLLRRLRTQREGVQLLQFVRTLAERFDASIHA